MKKQTLGEKMKSYEKTYDFSLLNDTYFVIRLDGRRFSKFCKRMKFTKPFDSQLIDAMKNTAKTMMQRTGALITYVQSDEITLVFPPNNIHFGRRIQKLTSVSASECAVIFNQQFRGDDRLLEFLPVFDCRVFNVPNSDEAVNSLIWRLQDAVKNSIQALAQAHMTKTEMFKVHTGKLKTKLLKEKGVDWDKLPEVCKYGTFFVRQIQKISVNQDNIDEIMKTISCKPQSYDLVRQEMLNKGILNRQEIMEINKDLSREEILSYL